MTIALTTFGIICASVVFIVLPVFLFDGIDNER